MRLRYSKPTETLAKELQEVARDAGDLLEQLRGINYLPPTFPTSQLADIARALVGLPAGTAEGCRAPLEYSRNRLPSIRREHILSDDGITSVGLSELTPSVMRRGALDERMRYLIASVTTALDEYRKLASDASADGVDLETSVPQGDHPSVTDAITQSKALESALTMARKNVEQIRDSKSERADDLDRQLCDASGLNRLANAELGMPEVMPSWLRKTIDALKDYPALIRQTANGLKLGVDILEIALTQWNGFKLELEKLVLERLKKVCDALHKAADRLEQHRKGDIATVKNKQSRPDAADSAQLERPEDFDLTEAARMIVEGKAPPRSWRPFITSLSFSSTRLRSLDPLRELTYLETIDLDNTKIRDLTPLAKLTRLRRLNLMNTSVGDLFGIVDLVNLETLDLDTTSISDLAPIADLAKLQHLNARNTKVRSITSLAELNELKYLDLNGTKVVEIKVIARLKQLQYLNLANTGVRNLGSIETLTSLRHLDISNTKVSDLTPIALLHNMTDLNITSTPITDLSAISNLTNLEHLTVINTKVRDLTVAYNLPNLTRLRLRDVQQEEGA